MLNKPVITYTMMWFFAIKICKCLIADLEIEGRFIAREHKLVSRNTQDSLDSVRCLSESPPQTRKRLKIFGKSVFSMKKSYCDKIRVLRHCFGLFCVYFSFPCTSKQFQSTSWFCFSLNQNSFGLSHVSDFPPLTKHPISHWFDSKHITQTN